MKQCYLVTTEHLEEGLWFRDEEDFVAGMNFVAIQVHQSKVTVLAFILMSNHLHFVLLGSWNDVRTFVDGIKTRHSRYLYHKYGIQELLRRNSVDIKEVSPLNEGFEMAIAYSQMNPVAANICAHPTQYPWGTGPLFFNGVRRSGTRLGDLSKRARIRLLHSTQEDLPAHWMVGKEGYVLPESYVDIDFVERLYRTPGRMNYFLSNSSKARRRLESSDIHQPAFRDQSILAVLPDLCRSLFQKSKFKDLTVEQQVEVLRQLRRRFSANVHQVARVTGLTYEKAAKLLDDM
mgnify:FL=1